MLLDMLLFVPVRIVTPWITTVSEVLLLWEVTLWSSGMRLVRFIPSRLLLLPVNAVVKWVLNVPVSWLLAL